MSNQEHETFGLSLKSLVDDFLHEKNVASQEKIHNKIELLMRDYIERHLPINTFLRCNQTNCVKIAKRFERLIQPYHLIPFRQSTLLFLNGPIQQYVNQYLDILQNFMPKETHLLTYRRLIHAYLASTDASSRQQRLKHIEVALKNDIDKAHCTMPYLSENNRLLIRNVYLTGDNTLIHLFNQFFAIPKQAVFTDVTPPASVLAAEEKSIETLKKITATTPMERITLRLQRQFRQKKWQQKITELFNTHWPDQTTAQLLAKADLPYRPQQCSAKLANRIMKAASNVQLFDTVRHYTDTAALTSLFDDGIYARQLVRQHYLPESRIRRSPLNPENTAVIRFPIHPIQFQDQKNPDDIELIFNSESLLKNNPSLVYEHHDLSRYHQHINLSFGRQHMGFLWGEARPSEPSFGLALTAFTQPKIKTEPSNGKKSNVRRHPATAAHIPRYLFMPQKLDNLHQILALNFFRYIDIIHQNPDNKGRFKFIYRELETLSDEDLERFIKDIGGVLTETAAFHVNGGHQIDFHILKAIKRLDYTLDLPLFIQKLNTGEKDPLLDAIKHLPKAFHSRRFLDYLLKVVHHKENHRLLFELKKKCATSSWEDSPTESPLNPVIQLDASEINRMTVAIEALLTEKHLKRYLQQSKLLDFEVLQLMHDYLQNQLDPNDPQYHFKRLIAIEALNSPTVCATINALPQYLKAAAKELEKAQRQEEKEHRLHKEMLDDRHQFEDLFRSSQYNYLFFYNKSIDLLDDFLTRHQHQDVFKRMRQAWDKLPTPEKGSQSAFEEAFVRTMIYICYTLLRAPTLSAKRAKFQRPVCDNVLNLLCVISALPIKERLENYEILTEALKYGSSLLLWPSDKNVDSPYPEDYNKNITHIDQILQKLPGHGSITQVLIGLLLMLLGLSTIITFVLMSTIPALATPFAVALMQTGLYHIAATIGGSLGAVAGASIVGGSVGLGVTATGYGLFATVKHTGVAKAAETLATTTPRLHCW